MSKSMKQRMNALRKMVKASGLIRNMPAEMTLVKPKYLREKIGGSACGYVSGPEFYLSKEWRELRYKALRNSNGRCACCGAGRREGTILHVDHIKPRYKHPELALVLSNLQVLCEDCNKGKGAWDQTKFEPWGSTVTHHIRTRA